VNDFESVIKSKTILHDSHAGTGNSPSEQVLQAALNSKLQDYGVSSQFQIDTNQATVITNEIILGYSIGSYVSNGMQADLDQLLNKGGVSSIPHDSPEYEALMSLFYNSTPTYTKPPNVQIVSDNLIGSKLLHALATGNRAAAWYEIRYNTNKNALGATPPSDATGIANRRYQESDMFGLYDDPSQLTDVQKLDEAEQIYQMFTLHRDDILHYEAQYSPTDTNAGSTTIADMLDPAKLTILNGLNNNSNADIVNAYHAWVDAGNNPATLDPTKLFLDPGNGGAVDATQYTVPGVMGTEIASNDVVIGGSSVNITQDSMLVGGMGDDLLIGGTGNDVLWGGEGNDILAGGTGNDTLYSKAGYDTLIGGAGNDTLISATGNDILVGGTGDTSFVVNSSTDVIQAQSTGSNTNTVISSVSYVLAAHVDNLILTGTADLTGTGNDINNIITANSGNDILIAGPGIATLVGGTGNDVFVVNNTADIILAQSTGSNTNTVMSSADYVVPQNVQNLILTGIADLMATGNDSSNTITANSGNDTLIGGSGNTSLIGGTGNDLLIGGSTMVAGSGNDQIFAGLGSATIQIDPATVGTDIIGGAGTTTDFLNAYYQSMGINDWQSSYEYAGLYQTWRGGFFSDPVSALNNAYNGDWSGEINQQIHRAIVGFARNGVLKDTHDVLLPRAERARFFGLSVLGRWDESVRDHQEILEALKGW